MAPDTLSLAAMAQYATDRAEAAYVAYRAHKYAPEATPESIEAAWSEWSLADDFRVSCTRFKARADEFLAL